MRLRWHPFVTDSCMAGILLHVHDGALLATALAAFRPKHSPARWASFAQPRLPRTPLSVNA